MIIELGRGNLCTSNSVVGLYGVGADLRDSRGRLASFKVLSEYVLLYVVQCQKKHEKNLESRDKYKNCNVLALPPHFFFFFNFLNFFSF